MQKGFPRPSGIMAGMTQEKANNTPIARSVKELIALGDYYCVIGASLLRSLQMSLNIAPKKEILSCTPCIANFGQKTGLVATG
ncbi:MAG: hypothetical protein UY19_C0018G0002 [Candidatus Wolfebacteria bacterium GW2011_GWA2_47_9b]|uniref:Uncharacterized protein n=1 Tax=Candidatus Wolfebacteria bacterium GW2011_GWA2_47_9b TaxID=1619005 RepID=A0A0G1U507_9BACT|nr:MAG: hypothetical protein UY19_C0018G0002 [Candidatus Wolfebacteria bacterium GW2011_GWA2_47_9b]